MLPLALKGTGTATGIATGAETTTLAGGVVLWQVAAGAAVLSNLDLLAPTTVGSFGQKSVQPATAMGVDVNTQTQQVFYLYHYTQPKYVPGIMAAGLWPGSFATDNPLFSPSVAQQALALPNPIAPTVVIPIRVEPGDIVIGPRCVERTFDPARTGGGVEYIFPGGVPADRLGTPYPAAGR